MSSWLYKASRTTRDFEVLTGKNGAERYAKRRVRRVVRRSRPGLVVPQDRALKLRRFGVRARGLAVVVGLLLASIAGTSCAGSDVECSMLPSSGTFVGTLRSIQGTSATFTVESWTPTQNDAASTPSAAPVVGASVAVQYSAKEVAFLRVGRRYSVLVYDGDGGFVSSVRHADDKCSGGTVYADGSKIDTSLWSRSIVRRAALGFIVLLLLTLVVLAFVTRRLRDRRARVSVGRPPREE